MNFKTTFILIVLLAGVGGYLFFTRDTGTEDKTPTPRKLVDLKREDISKVVVTAADGKQTILEKTGADWQVTKPINAPADSFQVGSLLDSIVGLTSTAEVDLSNGDAPKTGLDQPQFVVDVTANGKDTKLLIGNKLGLSDGVYVRVPGRSNVQVVSANLLDKLDRPAGELRQTKLVQAASNDIKQITITRKDGIMSLQKTGDRWQIVQPSVIPVDPRAVSDLLGAITGLQAVSFVDQPSEAIGFDAPQLTVFYSTQPPTTQPATTQPATMPTGVTITFGGPDDVLKKNVFVKLSDSPAVVKVAATSLDSLNKKPLDLRDKNVLSLDPKEVNQFSVLTDVPAATQPTSRPAKKAEVQVTRWKDGTYSGPPLVPAPTVRPTSMPSTTSATTQPTGLNAAFTPKWPGPKPAPWQLASAPKGDADLSDVNAFLDAFHPLQAEKYLEKSPAPTTRPASSYVVHFTTVAAGGKTTDYEIRFSDRADDQPLVAEYNGLTFEVARPILTNLQRDFKKKAAAPSMGMPGMQGVPGMPTP